MPKVIIDTSNAPDSGGFEPYSGEIPQAPGPYKALFKKGWWTKSSTGKPMLKVLFVLDSTKESVTKFNGYPLFHNITNEPSTAWKMKELFAALGTGPKSAIDFDEKGNVTRIGSARPGKSHVLVVGQNGKYKGERRMEIQKLGPLPGTTVTEDVDASEDATPYDEVYTPEESGGVGDGWTADDEAWANDPEIGGEPPF